MRNQGGEEKGKRKRTACFHIAGRSSPEKKGKKGKGGGKKRGVKEGTEEKKTITGFQ